jgi:hypothetical protein
MKKKSFNIERKQERKEMMSLFGIRNREGKEE